MNDQQLDLIRRFTTELSRSDQRAWLFGGWGLDARIGRVTRTTATSSSGSTTGRPTKCTRSRWTSERSCSTRSPWRAKDIPDMALLRSMLGA